MQLFTIAGISMCKLCFCVCTFVWMCVCVCEEAITSAVSHVEKKHYTLAINIKIALRNHICTRIYTLTLDHPFWRISKKLFLKIPTCIWCIWHYFLYKFNKTACRSKIKYLFIFFSFFRNFFETNTETHVKCNQQHWKNTHPPWHFEALCVVSGRKISVLRGFATWHLICRKMCHKRLKNVSDQKVPVIEFMFRIWEIPQSSHWSLKHIF